MERSLSLFETLLSLGVLVSCFSPNAAICTPGTLRAGTNCNTYYYCSSSTLSETLLSCQNHLVFNPNTNSCDYPQHVPGCGGNTGVVTGNQFCTAGQRDQPYPSDCTRYYRCVNGYLQLQQCTSGMGFNSFTAMCDYNGCRNQGTLGAQCINGQNQAHPSDCRKFYQCQNGQLMLQTCTYQFAFNPQTRHCDYLSNVPGCSAQVQSTCFGQSNQRHATDCTKYYSCQNGAYVLQSCGYQMGFNSVTGRCDYMSNIAGCSTGTTSYSVCRNSPCRMGGTCIATSYNGQSDYYCLCPVGYSGKDCGSVIDKCSPNPCGLGTCSANSGISQGFVCVCPSHRTGSRCQSAVVSCASVQCLNGGNCVQRGSQASCTCPLGYTGPRCETRLQVVNPCFPNPCGSGQCQQLQVYNQQQRYQCVCPNGIRQYTPCLATVQVVNPCFPNPCGSGQCQQLQVYNQQQRYQCVCPNGIRQYTPCLATVSVQNPCYPNPCGTGQCQQLTTSLYGIQQRYQCICPGGIIRPYNCLTVPVTGQRGCFPNPCGYGSCQVTASGAGYLCRCYNTLRFQTTPCYTSSLTWKGVGDKVTNRCTLNPCKNGECIVTSNGDGYTCRCPVGMTGKDCHTDVNECTQNPCGRGKCLNSVGGYKCDCTGTGYEGKMCDVPMSGKKKK